MGGPVSIRHRLCCAPSVIADGAPVNRVETAHALLEELPPTNWLHCNPLVGDHLNESYTGLFDLLLNSQDRAYTVPELGAFVNNAGMKVTAFIAPFA